jgi:hypothetical protein
MPGWASVGMGTGMGMGMGSSRFCRLPCGPTRSASMNSSYDTTPSPLRSIFSISRSIMRGSSSMPASFRMEASSPLSIVPEPSRSARRKLEDDDDVHAARTRASSVRTDTVSTPPRPAPARHASLHATQARQPPRSQQQAGQGCVRGGWGRS